MTSLAHAKQASSRDASFSQPGLFSIRLATAPGSWSVSCLTSIPRQKGKAVITNEPLLMKRSLTMRLDQCVAPSWNGDNIITLHNDALVSASPQGSV